MRHLICTAAPGTPAITTQPPVRVSMPAGRRYEIIEGMTGMTPFSKQHTHVSQETAESLIVKYPAEWRIEREPMNEETKATPTAAAIQPAPHPHFSLGQIIGLALLGLQAYRAQDAPASGGPKVFLDPDTDIRFVQGILSLFPQAPAQ